MSGIEVASWTLSPVVGAGVGLLLGMAYFANLRRVSARILLDASPIYIAVTAVVRFAIAALVFLALTRLGAGAVISGLGGFTVARSWTLARKERKP